MKVTKDLVAASATPMVLGILAEADSYGHSRAAGREYVWAEILQGADPCP